MVPWTLQSGLIWPCELCYRGHLSNILAKLALVLNYGPVPSVYSQVLLSIPDGPQFFMVFTIHTEDLLHHGILASPLVTISEPACLYFSTGPMNESFSLTLLTSERIYLGRLSSGHEDWVRVAVELPLGSYYLMFAADGKLGELTIADIYLAAGECNRSGGVPKGPNNNNPAMLHMMACHRTDTL